MSKKEFTLVCESKIANALKVDAIMLFGVVFFARKEEELGIRLVRHEYVHILQWRSLLGTGFIAGIILSCIIYAYTFSLLALLAVLLCPLFYYIWYIVEFLVRFILLGIKERKGFKRTWYNAYKAIVFEQEARWASIHPWCGSFEPMNLNFLKYYKKPYIE